ncbi:MAG: hypothetical protein PHI52_05180 [Bacteroidales bacterium]|nr:hypothetical protein [Bacteroidales bacterium]
MKTLFKTIVIILLSLLFMHCKPEPIEPEPKKAIHYVDYNPDICFDFDDTAGLKEKYIDLFEDNINDIFAGPYYDFLRCPQMTCLQDSIFIYYGDRRSAHLDPILENVEIGNYIDYRIWKQYTNGELNMIPSNTDVFVALKFIKKDGTHFGWMRINTVGHRFFIKDYAIHNTVEATILTGQKEKK